MELLSGNEAIARGAWEAGVRVAAAYPGTPSTETLEALAKMPDVYAEWCTNEKVAVEVALGASAAGVRTLTTMKHVGVNVAADPLFTAAYTGVGGGMVVLAADDPGMYSSQNEQDSHFYAAATHIPMLDPADSAEAHKFTRLAYGISEEFDVPVFIRSSVRISHTKTPVEVGERANIERREYKTDPSKWVMMPAFAKPKRKVQLSRIKRLEEWADSTNLNVATYDSPEIGVICYGSCYQHVREALPHASILKLGVSYPMPKQKLAEFYTKIKHVFVIEEGSNYLRDSVSACGLRLTENPESLPEAGELTPGIIAKTFAEFGDFVTSVIDKNLIVDSATSAQSDTNLQSGNIAQSNNKVQTEASSSFSCSPKTLDLPPRPPALCPGCPHRLVFKELSRLNAIVTGDIGCYTLGALPPLSAMDTTVDMGASVSMSHGMELALADSDHRPICAVIGDSTFAHSGLSSLISTVYNKGGGTVCILDNRTTAMTGRQGNPFNGVTLQNRPSHELDLEGVVRAIGVENVQTIDPHNMKDVRRALRGATESDDLSVLIFRSPCALLDKRKDTPYEITHDCTGCGVCLSLGCPAISRKDSGAKCDACNGREGDAESDCSVSLEVNRRTQMQIDVDMCVGCGQCAQYCGFGAIVQTVE